MPKVLPAIFSYEDMKSKFAEDNPDDPYTRRSDLESGIYELDKWLIRVDDDNKAISTVGFKEHPSHTVVGGMYASAKGREIGGNNRALQIAREPQLNQSKPLVAAFGHRDGDNARWIAKAKQNGWKFPEDDGFQQISELLPEQVVSAWNSAYPNGNWAIRSIRGEGEFAKCVYLDDPTPAWFNLLKIWRPNERFKKLEDGSYVDKEDGFKMNIHYMQRGDERLDHKKQEIHPTILECLRNKQKSGFTGKVWDYFTPDPRDWSHYDANIGRSGIILFESVRARMDRQVNKDWMGYPSYGEFIDCWNVGIKSYEDNKIEYTHGQSDSKNVTGSKIVTDKRTHDDIYLQFKANHLDPINNLKRRIKNIKRDNPNRDITKLVDKLDKRIKNMTKEYKKYKREHKRRFSQEAEDELRQSILQLTSDIKKMLVI